MVDFAGKRSVRVMIISLKAGWVWSLTEDWWIYVYVRRWCFLCCVLCREVCVLTALHISIYPPQHRGVGLNLTSANLCFLLDPWWNPAMEDQ